MTYKLTPTKEETYTITIKKEVAPYLEADYLAAKREGETKEQFLKRKAEEYILAVYMQGIQKKIAEQKQKEAETSIKMVAEEMKTLMSE